MKLSIIIPTLNEEDYLEDTIGCARSNIIGDDVEIIVVDAGSDDRTCQLADSLGVHLMQMPALKGMKYASLNAGANKATGDIFLFLDADTFLPDGYDKLIDRNIRNGVVGGAFRLKFNQTSHLLKLICYLNELRYRMTHHFFGDQGLFCTREAFLKADGYPEKEILESAHFCRRLKKIGTLKLINAPVISSSRRFLDGGVTKVFFQDLKIYVKDLISLSIKKESSDYWAYNQR